MINVTPSSSIRVLGIGEEYRVADLLSALDELAALRARVALYEKDGTGVVPVSGGLCEEVYRDGEFVSLSTSEAGTLVQQLRARVAVLEAPPVVPEGWWVVLDITSWDGGWKLRGDGVIGDVAYVDRDGWLCTVDGESSVAPWSALLALEYAHRTNQRPPHAEDAP